MSAPMKKEWLDHPEKYFVTHKIGELYFRFIKGTPLQDNGWTGEKLAKILKDWGFITVTFIRPQDSYGRFLVPGETRYYFLPGKTINKKDLVQLVLAKHPHPPKESFKDWWFKKPA